MLEGCSASDRVKPRTGKRPCSIDPRTLIRPVSAAPLLTQLGLARVDAHSQNFNCLAFATLLALGRLTRGQQFQPAVEVAVDSMWRCGIHAQLRPLLSESSDVSGRWNC